MGHVDDRREEPEQSRDRRSQIPQSGNKSIEGRIVILIKKLRRFVGLASDQRWLLAEAVLFLYAAKIFLMILSLRTVLKISLMPKKTSAELDTSVLPDIRWAIRNAGRLSFWKNRCLVQSIAGMWMLQRRGILSQITFGVKHDNNKKVIAHAWLTAGDVAIVDESGGYSKLGSFNSDLLNCSKDAT